MYEKLTKCPNFYDISQNINKIPEFYMIIVRKIFSRFFEMGGTCPCPSPVSYAYALG